MYIFVQKKKNVTTKSLRNLFNIILVPEREYESVVPSGWWYQVPSARVSFPMLKSLFQRSSEVIAPIFSLEQLNLQ